MVLMYKYGLWCSCFENVNRLGSIKVDAIQQAALYFWFW